jgi:4-hydroxybenzoate polyprenyltransferase
VTLAARAAGVVRLTHPFPSLLDGIATAVFALVAGALPADALRLGVAMTSIQVAIGTVNDLVDAPADAVAKPAKPIPSGLVPAGVGRLVAGIAVGVAVVLSIPSGWGTVALGLVCLAVGLTYDFALKGTAWSWLPFAVGIPLLPVFAWYGAVGTLPATFAVLIPTAVAAGAALAIGNAIADLERDEASGVTSIATALDAERAWRAQVVLLGAVGLAAFVSAAVLGATPGQLAIVAVAAVVPFAAALAGRGRSPGGRERAWEAEAVGVALLAVAWIWVAMA